MSGVTTGNAHKEIRRRKAAQLGVQHDRLNWERVREWISAAQTALAAQDQLAPGDLELAWARRAAALARVPAKEETGDQVDLVLLRLGRETYGFDAHYVLDIRPALAITPVPRVPEWIAGVANHRGRILSVTDLKRYLRLPGPEAGRTPRDEAMGYLVVVAVGEMELALLVDDVLAVETVLARHLEAATDAVSGIRPEYARWIIHRHTAGAASLAVILDLPALLGDARLVIHEEII